jgi:hypothetical protein
MLHEDATRQDEQRLREREIQKLEDLFTDRTRQDRHRKPPRPA